ncbi:MULTISPECIES: cytochrome P450 [unclassified Nocardia]|uniref:cytochrome P450 n=1 Tax=unclassified Nocardia TaxID=2637762 RepID=UPI001CE42078|nr:MULTISPECIES: cytochrome P450 [unclassified Nocardia]
MTEKTTLPKGLEWWPDTGQWVVRTHELADIALRDPHIGMSLDPDRSSVPLPAANDIPTIEQFFELWYRRGANHPEFGLELRRAYTAAALRPFASRFDAIAADLRRGLPAFGDLVPTFITPYGLRSTFDLMGFAEPSRPALTKAYHVLMFVLRQRFRGVLALPEKHLAAFAAALRCLRAALAEPRPTPLMAALRRYAETHDTSAWADVATIAQLLAAGVPQIGTGIGVSVRALFGDRELLARVKAGEFDIEQVAEEAMRLVPPFLVVAGWVTEPCDCLGVHLDPRTPVLVDIPAVNTDPTRVERPLDFCPARGRADNITFGKGTHYCLGATSARIQVCAALRGLLDLDPMVDPAAVRIDYDGFSQSVRSLPFTTTGRLI